MRFLGMFEKDNAHKVQSLLDNMPREALKEIEACLIEIAREREAAQAAEGEGISD